MFERHIISIGGGSIRATGKRPPQTTAIDETIVRATGKRRPRALFIPTASLDDEAYRDAFVEQYGKRLGCRVEQLLLYQDRPSRKALRERILNADLIYVGGGNTLRMMKLWRQLDVVRYLNQARKRGCVLAGLSAGAICWFRFGNSDSRSYSNPGDATLIRVSGLDYVDATCCPHYDAEKNRKPGLRRMMTRTPGVAVALDNCAAIEIKADHYRILTSKRGARAYRVYWSAGDYYQERLMGGWQSLAALTDKRIRY